ncbi:hypothetical protein B0H14DRAFT_3438523 [Mycena olivaceomarginata]|nr:hypothetical protein B0H14DRAFT_3438523 [Mycena olivaceomarginata]
MADSYPGILLCEPKYAPDPGHEDRYKHPGPFYVVVCKEWRGIVTSKRVMFFLSLSYILTFLPCCRASRKHMLERYPHAYTWEASPWWTLNRRWTLDCTEYHKHEGECPVANEPIRPVTPDSGQRQPPPSTDSGSCARPLGSPRQPGSASISPPRLTQQKTPMAVPEKQNTALLAHKVATALHMGGRVVLTMNGPTIVMPQGAHEAEQGAREAEEGEESQGENLGLRRCKEVEVFVEV